MLKIPQEDGEVHNDYKDSVKAIQIVKDFNEGRIISKIHENNVAKVSPATRKDENLNRISSVH